VANRINRNLRWVKRQLDKAGLADVLEEEILDAMSGVELEILGRTGSIIDKTALTFDSTAPHDTGQYVLGATQGSVLTVAPPATWSKTLTLTNSIEQYEALKAEIISGEQPEIVLQMNGSLYFWPVGVDGDIVTIYSIATKGAYSQVEGAGDPTVDWGWDQTLRYGALSRLLPPGNPWEKKYEDEYKTQAHTAIQQSGAPLLVDHSSNRLGF